MNPNAPDSRHTLEMLIDELKKGSPQAFRTLVERFSRDVVRTCYSFVHNAEDAEDLAQEVFIEVYQSVHRFREESELGTWIYRIAINKSLDALRRISRKKRIADLKSLLMFKSRSAGTPHQELEEKERQTILREHIALLPENQRVALVLSRYDRLSNRHIADIMAVSESAVESLLHRARENLRKNLAKYFEKKL